MPGPQRLRGDDRGHFGQKLSSQTLGSDRQPTTLVVIEPQPAIHELLAQHPVLLTQILNDLLLVLIHPSRNSEQQELERIKDSGHLVSSGSRTSGLRSRTDLYASRSIFRSIRDDNGCDGDTPEIGADDGTNWLGGERPVIQALAARTREADLATSPVKHPARTPFVRDGIYAPTP